MCRIFVKYFVAESTFYCNSFDFFAAKRAFFCFLRHFVLLFLFFEGTKKTYPCYFCIHKRHANARIPRKNKGTSTYKQTNLDKRMVFRNFWRFLMYPSLENTVIYLQLYIFYKLFFVTFPPCWNFLLQNIPLRSDFCKSESLFSRKKRKDIDGKSFFNTVIPLTILSDCEGDFS